MAQPGLPRPNAQETPTEGTGWERSYHQQSTYYVPSLCFTLSSGPLSFLSEMGFETVSQMKKQKSNGHKGLTRNHSAVPCLHEVATCWISIPAAH